MQAPVKHIVSEQTLWLSGQRVIFWEEEQSLIVSDCHFGKTGHFRKSGIAVPQQLFRKDMQRLLHQVQHFNAKRLIITGDFFHSKENSELGFFKKWRNDIGHVEMTLVKGNHDILKDNHYADLDITVHEPALAQGPFFFCHDPNDSCIGTHPSLYTFTGHIHPGISIRGAGRQSLHFPCFYFTDSLCILPAFSEFTGLVSMRRSKNDKVFAIVEQKVVEF